jgi:hypothetical protein
LRTGQTPLSTVMRSAEGGLTGKVNFLFHRTVLLTLIYI